MAIKFLLATILVSVGVFLVALFQFSIWPKIFITSYTVLVAVTCYLSLKNQSDIVINDQDSDTAKTDEEIILEIITQKGSAKRHDLLPHLDMSKSTLVRLLDEMEEKGQIVQIGERKASYYTLPAAKLDSSEL